ncbi:MAG: sulfatase-like hydrolase/transferase, partial [Planctomycetota bacterium]
MIRLFLSKQFLIGVGLVLLILFGWWFFGKDSGAQINHVVIISMDTTRADYLSCYGYEHKTTPNIDAVAAEAVRFEHVIAPIPLTLPSHSTMMTGT